MVAEIWWSGHVAPPQGAGDGPWVEHGVGSLSSTPPTSFSPARVIGAPQYGEPDFWEGLRGLIPKAEGSRGRNPAARLPAPAPSPAWACLARSARAGPIRMRAACAYWYAGACPARA